MIGYYDLVLVLVPAALVGIPAVLGAIGVGFMAALPVGASAAGLVVGHALFVNTPTAGAETVDAAPSAASSSAPSSPPTSAD